MESTGEGKCPGPHTFYLQMRPSLNSHFTVRPATLSYERKFTAIIFYTGLRIQISPSTKELLDSFAVFQIVERGEIPVKGKGMMRTWWLVGEK